MVIFPIFNFNKLIYMFYGTAEVAKYNNFFYQNKVAKQTVMSHAQNMTGILLIFFSAENCEVVFYVKQLREIWPWF